MNKFSTDLGFTFQTSKSGEVVIFHHGKLATVLRANKSTVFLDKIQTIDFPEQQQIMARLTGNYKRGNERTAKNHPRNRR